MNVPTIATIRRPTSKGMGRGWRGREGEGTEGGGEGREGKGEKRRGDGEKKGRGEGGREERKG